MEDGGRKKFAIYSIRDKGEGQKPYWMKLGIAYVNRDGSFNLYLDALPLDGKLQLREWRDEERHGQEAMALGEGGVRRVGGGSGGGKGNGVARTTDAGAF